MQRNELFFNLATFCKSPKYAELINLYRFRSLNFDRLVKMEATIRNIVTFFALES